MGQDSADRQVPPVPKEAREDPDCAVTAVAPDPQEPEERAAHKDLRDLLEGAVTEDNVDLPALLELLVLLVSMLQIMV